jgi:hypothetical protein
MLSLRASLAFVLFAALSVSPSLGSRVHHAPTGGHAQLSHTHSSHGKTSHKRKAKAQRLHGQQAIDPSRVTEIQQALIREHYLTGEANGSHAKVSGRPGLANEADARLARY